MSRIQSIYGTWSAGTFSAARMLRTQPLLKVCWARKRASSTLDWRLDNRWHRYALTRAAGVRPGDSLWTQQT
jgi:hypothetical protein